MIARPSVSLLEFYSSVYRLHRPGRSTTDEAFLGAIRRFQKTLGRQIEVRDLCDELLLDFRRRRLLVERRNGKKLSPATINRDERHVKAVGSFARRRGLCDWRPDVEPLKTLKRTAIAWDFLIDVPRIMAAIDHEPGAIGGLPMRALLRALVGTLVYTGARISVAMSLPLSAVSFERGTIRLPAEFQKQGADQELLLHARALEYLRAIARPERPLLFPWPYDRGQPQWPALNRRLKKIIRRARLSDAGPRLWHKLRVTCATYLYVKTGGNIDAVRRQLGHSSVQVTFGYVDFTKTSQPTAALLLDDLPSPSPQLRLFGS